MRPVMVYLWGFFFFFFVGITYGTSTKLSLLVLIDIHGVD